MVGTFSVVECKLNQNKKDPFQLFYVPQKNKIIHITKKFIHLRNKDLKM